MKIKTEIIRRTINERNLTQKAAAERAGIPYDSFLAIMRRGTCNGTTLGKLARFCKMKAYELVDI